jgi:serine/threonine protein kinase
LPLSPKGHPRYKAPEITNQQYYTKKVDVFMYATVLYVLFANKRPYEKLNDEEVHINNISATDHLFSVCV